MKESKDLLVGICGIYCGTCPRYLAYQDQDLDELQKMAAADKIPLEDIRCDGCLSDIVYPACRDCRHGFRRCAEEKKVTWCFQCPDFPCQRLEDFSKIHTSRYEEAVSAYKKAIKREPNNFLAHLLLAATYSMMGRGKEAQYEVEEVRRLNPKFSVDYYAKVSPHEDQTETDKITDALCKAGLK